MNHDNDLKSLGDDLKKTFDSFNNDIDKIKNHKLMMDCRQNLDMAYHWALKMSMLLDDLNVYLSVFGSQGGEE